MTLTRSFPTQNPAGLPITDNRRVFAGLVARNSDGTPRAGVLPAHANPLVTGRASMGYDVAPFVAATSRINTGIELVANDAVTTVPTTAAPAANSRIDVIWVRSQFVQHVDANNDVVFGVTQGTAAAVPTKPTIPVGALELATATILSTTTTTATVVITQTHPYTAAQGGVVWLRNQPEQDAYTPANGALGFRLDTGATLLRVAGAWRVTSKEDTAWAALPMSNGWVNFGAPYSTARYCRIGGVVHVTGVIKSGSTGAAAIIGTLPPGFRPDAQILKNVPTAVGSGSIDVTVAGEIKVGANVSATFTALEFHFVAA